MNKNIGKLARFGLAVGIVRLVNRRRESRVRRLFRRLGPRRSFTARTTRQLSMLARRSSKQLGPQMRTLPLIGKRFGGRRPVQRIMHNLPLVAGLSLPSLSALSLPALSLRNPPWMSSRRESMRARQDGRTALGVRMAGVADMARNHRWLTVLGLGAALGLAGMFVFGRLVRTRSSAPAMPAWPDPYQRARNQLAGASPSAEMGMAGRTEAARRPEPAGGQLDWAGFCRGFWEANRDRRVNVEVQEAGGNVRALAHEVPLLGIDVGTEGVQLMLGEDMDNRMEHDILDPVGLHPIVDQNGAQAGLVIHAGDGSTTTLRLA